MRIEDARIVKEYALRLPRKSGVEGLEFVGEGDTHILMSTGSYGGYLNVLELGGEDADEWTLKSRAKVDPQYFGMGLTSVDDYTYLLTWKAEKVLKYAIDDLMSLDEAEALQPELMNLP